MQLKNGESCLTQWDRHQILVFNEYPPTTEIHMWCDCLRTATVLTLDSNREVVIPDILLQTSGMLRICVYVTNEYDTSYTEVFYMIPVDSRPRPDDYVFTPEETKIWEQKLDKNFGAENAGKFLAIADDGSVVPADVPGAEAYTGDYSAVPKFDKEVVLETKDKAMTDDVTVRKIPQFEVTNDAGGKTLILGDDYYGE